MTTKVARSVSPVSGYSLGDAGHLRTHTRVHAVDIFGRSITRRVSLGTDWNTTLETARETVQKVRENNPGIEINADYRIAL